jgi:hypothetical protein
MSVWKKLNKQDSFVTTYVAKKRWNLTSEEVEDFGIKFLPANSNYREVSCDFNIVAGILELSATVQNCTFRLEAVPVITQDCNFLLEAIIGSLPTSTPTQTPTSTITLTPTGTPLQTPTPTLECILELEAIV